MTAPALPSTMIRSGPDAIAIARGYAAGIAAGAIERDRTGAVPASELAEFDASGLLGITVPGRRRRPGTAPQLLAEVIRSIAAVDPAIAQVPQGHFLFVDVLAIWGTPRQRQRLFGSVLDGGRLANGQAERGGEHAQDLKTRIVPHRRCRTPAGSDASTTATVAITARWLGVSALDDDGHLVLAFVERMPPVLPR